MGFFSFITSDTKRSLPNVYSEKETFPVYVITKEGGVYTETEYEGYGRFDGVFIYDLIGELNNIPKDDVLKTLYETVITDGVTRYSTKNDFSNWQTPIHQGKCANELVELGWKKEYPMGYGSFKIAAEKGLSMPKIVETLTKDFDSLDYPENCPNQGYFY